MIAELRRLIQQLGQYVGNDSSGRADSVADVADSQLLRTLRALRPLIESSGDENAIDNFNHVMRYAKRRAQNPYLVSDQPGSFVRATDSRRKQQDDAEHFATAAKRYHGKSIKEGKAATEAAEEASSARRVADSDAEDWGDTVARYRREMLKRK